MKSIVKVQVPLFSSHGKSFDCLVYANGKKHLVEQPVSEATANALNGDAKGYFKAVWQGSMWKIGERIKDQNW